MSEYIDPTKQAMTSQEKLAVERAYYLEHPLIHYSFNRRPIMEFSHNGCEEYDITLFDVSQIYALNYVINKDLAFRHSSNSIAHYLYPLYFRRKVSEETFTQKRWSNVFIVNAKYVHQDADGRYYINIFIENNTCLELYLQIFSELYKYVDIDYTKQVIEKCNEAVYNVMDIDYTVSKLDEIGIVRDENMLERAKAKGIV